MAKPSDNSLGAPTEGLGQNVTFAYNTGRGPGALEIGDPGRIRAGVIGGDPAGGGTRAQGVQDRNANGTLDVLMKVGESIMAPMLKQRKTEAYVAGMQRAMQGEAVTEIATEQPWYSKIFGDSDVVEGARAYASNTVAQTTVNTMEGQMPELRKLDAQAAQKYFVDTVNAAATGDPATDLAVMQSLTRTLPSLMKRQAKEHYGYQQERATASEDTSFHATAEALQTQGIPLSTGYVSPEEFIGKQRAFVRGQVPAAGRDEENWKAAQTARYIKAAKSGQFHAVNAGYMPLEDGAPSAIEALDERQQIAVAAALESGQAMVANKYSDAWAPELAQLRYGSIVVAEGDNPDKLGGRIDGLNLKYQAETGSRQGLISPREKAAMMTRSGTEIAQERAKQAAESFAEQARLAAAGNKPAALAQEVGTYEKFFSESNLGDLVLRPGYTKEKADAVAFPMLAAMPMNQRADKMNRLRIGGFESPQLKRDLTGKMLGALQQAGAGGYTDDVKAVLDDYLTVYRKDPGMALSHYDDGQGLGARLQGWAYAVENGKTHPVQAFNYHMTGPKKHTRLSDSDTAATVKTVNSQFNGWTDRWLGDNGLKPGQAEMLTTAISSDVADLVAVHGDVPQAVASVMHNNVLSKKVEIIGGYVTGKAPQQVALSDYLTGKAPGLDKVRGPNAVNIGTDDVHGVFADAVAAVMHGDKAKGVRGVTDETGPVRVIRPGDRNGEPVFILLMNLPSGEVREALLEAGKIPEWAAKHRKDQAAAQAAAAARPRSMSPFAVPYWTPSKP